MTPSVRYSRYDSEISAQPSWDYLLSVVKLFFWISLNLGDFQRSKSLLSRVITSCWPIIVLEAGQKSKSSSVATRERHLRLDYSETISYWRLEQEIGKMGKRGEIMPNAGSFSCGESEIIFPLLQIFSVSLRDYSFSDRKGRRAWLVAENIDMKEFRCDHATQSNRVGGK